MKLSALKQSNLKNESVSILINILPIGNCIKSAQKYFPRICNFVVVISVRNVLENLERIKKNDSRRVGHVKSPVITDYAGKCLIEFCAVFGIASV